jgi:hypothetical protein
MTGSPGAPATPEGLGHRVRLPSGHWLGQHLATEVLALDCKGRAFRSLDTPLTRQGGNELSYGSARALAAALGAWPTSTKTPIYDFTRTHLR